VQRRIDMVGLSSSTLNNYWTSWIVFFSVVLSNQHKEQKYQQERRLKSPQNSTYQKKYILFLENCHVYKSKTKDERSYAFRYSLHQQI
jgi:hypothetical protein